MASVERPSERPVEDMSKRIVRLEKITGLTAEEARAERQEKEEKENVERQAKSGLEREIRRHLKRNGGFKKDLAPIERDNCLRLLKKWNEICKTKRTIEDGWDDMVIGGMV